MTASEPPDLLPPVRDIRELCSQCSMTRDQRIGYKNGCPMRDELMPKFCPWYDAPKSPPPAPETGEVERVAKAACHADGGDWNDPAEDRKRYRKIARAILVPKPDAAPTEGGEK